MARWICTPRCTPTPRWSWRSSRVYGQVDLRASLLDYLGLAAAAQQRIGRSLFYLARDWNYPGRRDVQSDGPLPSLAFELGDIDPSKQYEVALEFEPYIAAPRLPAQHLSFFINGRALAEQRFDSAGIKQGIFALAGSDLKPGEVNTFAIAVRDPVVPAQYLISEDHAQRGVDIVSFVLREKP